MLTGRRRPLVCRVSCAAAHQDLRSMLLWGDSSVLNNIIIIQLTPLLLYPISLSGGRSFRLGKCEFFVCSMCTVVWRGVVGTRHATGIQIPSRRKHAKGFFFFVVDWVGKGKGLDHVQYNSLGKKDKQPKKNFWDDRSAEPSREYFEKKKMPIRVWREELRRPD